MPALTAVLLLSISNSVCFFFNIIAYYAAPELYLWLWAAPALQRTIGQYRTTDVADNLGKSFSGAQRTLQGKDVEVIVTLKNGNYTPVYVFGICNHYRVMTA